MNCPTTGYPTPAAAPRTGWGKSAPRGTQCKTSIPFAAIPHDIAADPRLSPTDLRVLTALFYFARADVSCWPSDKSIAARVDRHPGTVRRSLRHLEDLCYIRRQPSRGNPTGRLIHLTCREPDWERPRQTLIPVRRRAGGSSAGARGDRSPAHAKGDVVVEGLKTEEFAIAERSRPDPAPSPVELPTPVAAVSLQAKVPTQVPPAPVIEPPQPALPVTTLTPIVAPQEPQFRPLRKAGPGPQVACPTLETPPVRPLPVPSTNPVPASLPLTPEQQVRLASLPAASRDQVLRWLATGDPILVAEARSKLAPLRPQPEAPQTLPELLGRIRQDPSYPALAASGLAAALQDQKSYTGYLRRCEEAWRGELSPDRLLSAYEQAIGPKARNRGAIFMVAVRQKE